MVVGLINHYPPQPHCALSGDLLWLDGPFNLFRQGLHVPGEIYFLFKFAKVFYYLYKNNQSKLSHNYSTILENIAELSDSWMQYTLWVNRNRHG